MRLQSCHPVNKGQLQTTEDRRWSQFEKELRAVRPEKARPEPPAGEPARQRVWRVAQSARFDAAVTLILSANAVLLCTQHESEPAALARTRAHSEVGFTALYVLEVAVKLAAYGAEGFAADQQDNIAAFCCAASIVDSGLFLSGTSCGADSGASSMLRLFRALRLVRLLRLASRVPGLELFSTAAQAALPLIWRITAVLVMEVLIVAQIGVALFYDVDFSMGGKNPSASFTSTVKGMQLLWITATGDFWVEFMTMASQSYYWTSALFFGLFLLSMQFIMLNLFTMVITECFEVLRDEKRAHINALVPVYCKIWHHFDPAGAGTIRREQLVSFVGALPPPLGIGAHRTPVTSVPFPARCCASSKKPPVGDETDDDAEDDGGGGMDSTSRAHVLLAQPNFAEGCDFTETLIGLCAFYLASAEGINVPAQYDGHALEQTCAMMKIKNALRNWVRKRRRRAGAGAAPPGWLGDGGDDDDDVAQLREELKEERDRSAETRAQLAQLRERRAADGGASCGDEVDKNLRQVRRDISRIDGSLELLCEENAHDAGGGVSDGPFGLFCSSVGFTANAEPVELAEEPWNIDVVREGDPPAGW